MDNLTAWDPVVSDFTLKFIFRPGNLEINLLFIIIYY